MAGMEAQKRQGTIVNNGLSWTDIQKPAYADLATLGERYQTFHKLYGQAKDREHLTSVLDELTDDLKKVGNAVSTEDRKLLDEHATFVREMEQELDSRWVRVRARMLEDMALASAAAAWAATPDGQQPLCPDCGSPPHQRPSPVAARLRVLNSPSASSRMWLWTMPWRSGRRPVTKV